MDIKDFKDNTPPAGEGISITEANLLKRIQRKDELHSICINILKRHVFSSSLEATIGDDGKVPDDWDIVFSRLWTNEMKIAYADLKAWGYSAFVLKETFINKKKYPLIKRVDRNHYVLKRDRDDQYNEVISVTWTSSPSTPKCPLFVFIDMNQYPDFETNTHNSIISSSIGHCLMMTDMMDCHMSALKQLSYPVMITNRTVAATTIQENLTQINRGNPLLGEDAALKESFDAVKANEQADIADEQYTSRHGPISYFADSYVDVVNARSIYPTVIENKYPMPIGWEVSANQPPQPMLQANILEFREKLENHITTKYGIPMSIMNSGARSGPRSSGNAIDDNDMMLFSHTIESEARLVRDFAAYAMDCYKKQTKINLDFNFKLRTRPFMSTAKIIQLADFDIISYDTMKKYVAQVSNISESDILIGKNNHDRPTFNGSADQTDPILKKKAKALESDSAKAEAEAIKILADAEKVKVDALKGHAEIEKIKAETESIKKGENKKPAE